jgi:hypothetical protein
MKSAKVTSSSASPPLSHTTSLPAFRSGPPTSLSSPQLTLPHSRSPNDPSPAARARASSEFTAPPFSTSKEANEKWTHLLDPGENVVQSGLVHLRKKLFFSRQKLVLLLTDKRLITADPSNNKVLEQYPWHVSRILATQKDSKSFTIEIHPKKTKHFEDEGAKQWVDLIKYFSTLQEAPPQEQK